MADREDQEYNALNSERDRISCPTNAERERERKSRAQQSETCGNGMFSRSVHLQVRHASERGGSSEGVTCDITGANGRVSDGRDLGIGDGVLCGALGGRRGVGVGSDVVDITREVSPTWEIACPPISEYDTPESAHQAMNAFARSHGYALVVKRSLNDQQGNRRRVIFACDRHGSRRTHHVHREGSVPRPNAGSRRCNCPMVINLMRSKGSVKWRLDHRGGETTHNHPPSTSLTSHPIIRRSVIADDDRHRL